MQRLKYVLGPYEVGSGTPREVKELIRSRFTGGNAPWNQDALSRQNSATRTK